MKFQNNINKNELNENSRKKFIWYENLEQFNNYKQNKPQFKIFFIIRNSDSNYDESEIMYLTQTNITLEELSKIVYKKINNPKQIRWLTENKLNSSRYKTYNTLLNDNSRHLIDIEPNDTTISYYYKNKIKLIVYFAYASEGC